MFYVIFPRKVKFYAEFCLYDRVLVKTYFVKKGRRNRTFVLQSCGFWRLWAAVGGCGQLWAAVGGCGWLWAAVGSCGQLWAAVGSCGRLWVGVGGGVRVRQP